MTFALAVVPITLLLLGFPIFMVLLTAVTVALVFFMHIPLAALHQNLFGSSFFVLTGFHGAHVTIGILMLLSLAAISWKGRLADSRVETVELIGLYWHFVDVVWIVIFTVVYLIPGVK